MKFSGRYACDTCMLGSYKNSNFRLKLNDVENAHPKCVDCDKWDEVRGRRVVRWDSPAWEPIAWLKIFTLKKTWCGQRWHGLLKCKSWLDCHGQELSAQQTKQFPAYLSISMFWNIGRNVFYWSVWGHITAGLSLYSVLVAWDGSSGEPGAVSHMRHRRHMLNPRF